MRLYLTLCVLLFFSALLAQKPIVLHGTPDWDKGVDLGESILFYEDKAREPLTLTEVQQLQTFRPFAEKRNERTTNSDVAVIRTWLKFTIQNTHPTDTAKMVYFLGAHARSFLYQEDKLVYRGGMRAFVDGYIPQINYLDVLIPPFSTHTYWLQVIDYELSAMPILSNLHTQHTATFQWASASKTYELLFFLMSVLVGCLLFMSFYSLYHFWLTRDSVFGYYALYVTSAMLVVWSGVESRFQFFYLSNLLKFNNSGQEEWKVITFNFIVPVLYILFVSKIAEISKQNPRIWLALKVVIGILIGQQFLGMYQSYTGTYFYSNLYYLNKNIVALSGTCLLLFGILRSKTPIKPYLVTGIFCFIVFVFAPMFFNFSTPTLSHRPEIEAIVNLTMFWVFLGLTLEAICFAFALAYRSRLIEIENNIMQINTRSN